MTESFIQLLEESFKRIKTSPGSIIRGTIISIQNDIVLVDAGLKSESPIPIEQFYNSQGVLEIKVGDQVDVTLDAVEDGFGETILSREKAKRYESWLILEKAYEEVSTVVGIINGRVKGGFTVELNGIKAFLPGSLVDIRPIRENMNLEGKEFEFKVIKLDQKRNNVVVSRRAVLESENISERNQLLEQLHEGMQIKGIVKNLTDYGAFIDLGGVDGLLHITDIAWKRIRHPSEVVGIGDEIIVKVLKFDREKNRVSLGLKQLEEDPWTAITKRYHEGMRLTGKVTNLTDYGCFVEMEGGIEGLVHISEMDWTSKNIHPSKVVNVGEFIEVMLLDIDESRRRISLGLKQCTVNPWEQFLETYNKGDSVIGKIKSITDFGIFIGLEGGIDGLVHLSDISWHLSIEEIMQKYKKGDEVAAVILQVDAERERISLSIKHLEEDPLNIYLSLNQKKKVVTGTILSINTKGMSVKLTDMIVGYVLFSDVDKQNEKTYNIGDNIEVKCNGIDRKSRMINLSIPFVINDFDNTNSKIINSPNASKQSKDVKQNFSNVMTEAFKAATKTDS
ncbi:30S ribosomal protein S1 [Blochmannia endosymbiont of Polyrhachis (Hedomyrma) turneri]|uniref:30S ribosomal protein S1 n=1 Tax=Blochmannia endosymbiont of Polyrhachis (Hedomyrma) turneri TaxID=1505596 RepID=UPI00061A684D|nr:30S ribosomal protein S1 [Blochmannia endosymbiont of Polyrhachis (Hedomyrma) turneri]AKC59946.1 30S ribosomal protein S1 [Blochmannia endosymbiont of Polyrhachis (Hedomyrma) turneri]